MGNPFTDAKLNLYQSLLYALDEHSHDVSIVFGGVAIAGTRARKQQVCKPAGGFDPRSERAQEILRAIQGGGGNGQPKPPSPLQGPG